MFRKFIYVIVFTSFLVILSGCVAEGEDRAYDHPEQIEQMDGFEGLTDEEINQKLIEQADQMEVVPDKTN